jgi:hypothetical protein
LAIVKMLHRVGDKCAVRVIGVVAQGRYSEGPWAVEAIYPGPIRRQPTGGAAHPSAIACQPRTGGRTSSTSGSNTAKPSLRGFSELGANMQEKYLVSNPPLTSSVVTQNRAPERAVVFFCELFIGERA